jgi:hypothetical protein
MAITTEAGLIAARASGAPAQFIKNSLANTVAGQLFSLYRAAGTLPAQPAIPAAAAVCTNATAGAIALPFTVSGGNSLYCDSVAMLSSVGGQIRLVDRIIHHGGLNGTTLGVQSIDTPALPGGVDAAKCRWFAEWYADTGATASNATFAVTHTDATTANIVIAVGGTVRNGRKIELVSPAGKPIASIQQLTSLSASTGTAGNFGVTCQQYTGVKCGVIAQNSTTEYESLMRLLPRADACLAAEVFCIATATGNIDGDFFLMQG